MCDFLEKAIELSETSKGGPFGAVIVKDNIIIGEGSNAVVSNCDPTAHAEIVAIRNACTNIKTHNLKGSTLYASSEPCPLCLSAIYWAGIDRVIYSNTCEDAEAIGFSDKFIYKELEKTHNEKTINITQVRNPRAIKVFHKWNGIKY